MKKYIAGSIISGALVLMACSHSRGPNEGGAYDPESPGYEYAVENDMYKSVPYDPMTQVWNGKRHPYTNTMPFADSMNMRPPVKGTIPYGKFSYYYPYAAGPEGYEASAANKDTIPVTDKTITEGKRLYEIYCWHCHGLEGNGDGPVMASGKFPPPFWKSYNSDYIRALPEGKMFHTITFGKNLMGPHGPLLRPEQRWYVIHYIKNRLAVKTADASAPADSAKTTTKPVDNNAKSSTKPAKQS